MRLLIKNGRVVDPATQTDETLDILIERGKIVDLKAKIDTEGSKVIDASRLVVAPGLIDMHTHLREPGQEEKETIETGSRAAAKGGFTTICTMPNTVPPNDNQGVTEFILSEAQKKAVVNVYPIAAITKGLHGAELTDMADLLEAGAVAFSDDGQPVLNSLVMRRALEYAQFLETLIIDHCEDTHLSEGGVMNEGIHSYRLGLRGIPTSAEEIMVARDIILAEKSRSRIHFAHVSVKGAVQLIQEAKRKKIQVTAEATPHHLLLSDSLLEGYDTNLKVNPPLRSQEDVEALLSAVKNGTIDVLATDHAPHSPEEKDLEFDRAPFGINGLETAVSLLLDRLVNKNIISIHRLIEMTSTTPARLLDLKNKGRIAVGADADLTILNLHKEIVVNVNSFQSKSRNSPFHNWKLKGAPEMTIVGGKIIYPFSS
ncbi:MAG: dihydroorotase [Candidatus Aminicenantales bacterium]